VGFGGRCSGARKLAKHFSRKVGAGFHFQSQKKFSGRLWRARHNPSQTYAVCDCDKPVTNSDNFWNCDVFFVTNSETSVTKFPLFTCTCYSVTNKIILSQFSSQIVTDINSVTIFHHNLAFFCSKLNKIAHSLICTWRTCTCSTLLRRYLHDHYLMLLSQGSR